MDEPLVADVTDPIEQAACDRLIDERKALRDWFVEPRRDEHRREVPPEMAAACTNRRQPVETRSSRTLTTSSTVHGDRSGHHVPSAVARAISRTNNGLPPMTSRTARGASAAAVVVDSCSRTSARPKPRRSKTPDRR